MQKLNGREIYVLVLLGLLSIILGFAAVRELTADFSSLRASSDADTVSITKDELISNTSTVVQAIVTVLAFIFFLLRKRIGWILAMPILTCSSLILLYMFFLAGFGTVFAYLVPPVFFLGTLFLFTPSTLRKFKVNKITILSVFLVMGLLLSYYFFLY